MGAVDEQVLSLGRLAVALAARYARAVGIPPRCGYRDDLAAAGLVGVWLAVRQGGAARSLPALAGKCAAREIRRWLDRRVRREGQSRHARYEPQPDDWLDRLADPAGEDAEPEPLPAAVREAVGRLPPRYRLYVTEHFLAGRSAADIAAELGAKPDTVRRGISDGVKRLRGGLGVVA